MRPPLTARSVLLMSLYSEYGHQGCREVHTTYALTVDGAAQDAVATLVVEKERRNFPGDGVSSNEVIGHFRIRAELLVALIEKHGERV